jgi:hypothetical protein
MNNRQGGRRRGRSGPRPQGMGGNSGGNARDNRQRGNAAQLLEKYKSMARDSQLAGDRVQTEYYLQFADHYFRVLSETRSRFEEQRRGRDDFDEDEDLDEESMEADGDDRQEQPRQEQRQDRRRDRPERLERAERPERSERADAEGEVRRERFAREDREQRRPRRDRFNGQDREGADEEAPRIALDTLPPAIGITEQAADTSSLDEEEAPKPRRRTRRPRVADEGDEIAPAA